MNNEAYTYIIGWSKFNVYYYGVRYANECAPEDDLWIKYFTSSKYVHYFRDKNGEPDMIIIDERFENITNAIKYEHHYLKELYNSGNWDFWLNKSVGGFAIIMDDALKEKLRESATNQFLCKENRKKHLEAFLSADGNHKNKIWINDGLKNKRVTKEVFDEKYSTWNKGRIIPKDSKFGNYDKSGKNNPFYGKKHTNKTKMLISKNRKGK